ncbi:hypothetical protein DSO57_1025684 [Entomophthora muscae]|uniref:Uncharacterized protein n=1 Tax=Entomophthora muscae TaxID=34485 RepID=A0ACC2U0B3_9FUNG|nr:hypothetical protein DSO57_1025684 [Entomophthora muscae]
MHDAPESRFFAALKRGWTFITRVQAKYAQSNAECLVLESNQIITLICALLVQGAPTAPETTLQHRSQGTPAL